MTTALRPSVRSSLSEDGTVTTIVGPICVERFQVWVQQEIIRRLDGTGSISFHVVEKPTSAVPNPDG